MNLLAVGIVWVVGMLGVAYLVSTERDSWWAVVLLVLHAFMTLAMLASANSKVRRHEDPGAAEDD